MQEKFWSNMSDLKYQLFYLAEYMEQSYKYDNYINYYTAIISFSSVGAWTIWNQFNYVWSVLIAISQVINALKNQLPYSKRTKLLPKLHAELTEVFNDYDYLWYKISSGQLTDEEINDNLKDLIGKDNKINNKYLIDNHLPYNEKLFNKAQEKYNQYYNLV